MKSPTGKVSIGTDLETTTWMANNALCQCGCGEPAGVYTRTRPDRGFVKGQPRKYKTGHGTVERGLLRSGIQLWEERDMGYITPCYVWLHGLNSRGYARLTAPDGTGCYGHLYFYEREHGPIPDGLHADHLCMVKACVRHDHIEPVTCAVNAQRATAARLGACKTAIADWELGRRLRQDGWTYQRIADELGVGIMSAWGHLRAG